jgi:hypothetical protein
MTTTDDPEEFRDAWHYEVNEFENLKQTLHPNDWDELDETLDDLHDIVDKAADQFEEN